VEKAQAPPPAGVRPSGARPAAEVAAVPPTPGVPAAAGASRVFEVTVNGEPFRVEVRGSGQGSAAAVVADVTIPSAPAVPPAVAGATKPAAAADATMPSAPAAQSGLGAGEQAVFAPMPGMIVEIVKQPGDAVKAGDTVCIIEAMKMNNNIETPCEGEIKELRCKQGDSVAKGDILCVVRKK